MPLKSLFAYSFQSFYLAGSFLLLFIFLPSFYNLSVGFALSTIGMIILISRVFDVFSDFFIGYFTEKRFIKGLPKKNQILFGIFIFIFCSFFMFFRILHCKKGMIPELIYFCPTRSAYHTAKT